MVKYKILLKSHWKTGARKKRRNGAGEIPPEPPDLVDLELASNHKLLYPTDKFAIKPDPERSVRIRLYKSLSSFTVYSMIFCLLYYSSTVVDDYVRDIRATSEKNSINQDAAIVKREMTTNLTHDEYMSSLSYDKFLEKVEAQSSGKKQGWRIVSPTSNNSSSQAAGVNHLNGPSEVGTNANSKRDIRNENQNEGSSLVSAGKASVDPQYALSLGKVFQKQKVVVEQQDPNQRQESRNFMPLVVASQSNSLPQMQQQLPQMQQQFPQMQQQLPQMQQLPNMLAGPISNNNNMMLPQLLPNYQPTLPAINSLMMHPQLNVAPQASSNNLPQQTGQFSFMGLTGQLPNILQPQFNQFRPMPLPQVPMPALPRPFGK